jgi:hypothetical protein
MGGAGRFWSVERASVLSIERSQFLTVQRLLHAAAVVVLDPAVEHQLELALAQGRAAHAHVRDYRELHLAVVEREQGVDWVVCRGVFILNALTGTGRDIGQPQPKLATF